MELVLNLDFVCDIVWQMLQKGVWPFPSHALLCLCVAYGPSQITPKGILYELSLNGHMFILVHNHSTQHTTHTHTWLCSFCCWRNSQDHMWPVWRPCASGPSEAPPPPFSSPCVSAHCLSWCCRSCCTHTHRYGQGYWYEGEGGEEKQHQQHQQQ